jgi:hypothetical protein
MVDLRAEAVDRIDVDAGDIFTLVSLRQAVVPPYVLIVPVIDLPPILAVMREDGPEGEGVHGVTYTLQALARGHGTLRIGFRDLRSGAMVREKSIAVYVDPPR